MFKRIALGTKIGLGFAVVLLLLAIGSIVSWRGLNTASNGFTTYRSLARDTNLCGRLQANMLMVRMNVKDFIITGSEKDIQEYNDYYQKMTNFMTEAQESIDNAERAALIDEADKDVKAYQQGFEKVTKYMERRNQIVNGVLNVQGPLMENKLTELMASADKDKDTASAYRAGLAMRNLLLARLYVVKFLDDNLKDSADRVNAEFKHVDEQLAALNKQLENAGRRKLLDEVTAIKATYTKSFDELVKVINDRNDVITNTLDRLGPEIAAGVENVKLSVMKEQDALGPALQASNQQAVWIVMTVSGVALIVGVLLSIFLARSITKPINRIIAGLTEGADQVSEASSQVSSSSQTLSEGASEQASSLEETSSALEEMSGMARQNADHAAQANQFMSEASRLIDEAGTAMKETSQGMEQISEASDQISKIIKVIEEIAFQTNLLALNAAVEAARAGEHGKGFAVVADEVRNLAQRAAEAARETGSLIEQTVSRVKRGVELNQSTTDSFGKVGESAAKVADLVAQITQASQEQAQGVEQVNTAMAQMDKVTQANAAGAEESASAAEELSAQAATTARLVAELATLVKGGAGHDAGQASVSTPVQKAASAKRSAFHHGSWSSSNNNDDEDNDTTSASDDDEDAFQSF